MSGLPAMRHSSGGWNAGVGDAAQRPGRSKPRSSGAAALHQPLTAGNPAVRSEDCRVSAWAENGGFQDADEVALM